MDFTLKTYRQLLLSLINQKYSFQRFDKYLQQPVQKAVILRHDVDLLPVNSLETAMLENSLGISGSYYFRAVPQSWDADIIIKIAELGHEIGYHYENLSVCKGDLTCAIRDFELNLNRLRKIVPVNTICMHGSPLSQYDSRHIWEKYDYADYGILGEPYFDIDATEVFYLTDTGRRWDGEKVSVRDKMKEPKGSEQRGKRILQLHSTYDIINAANLGLLPDKIMITIHPQRWIDKPLPWFRELVLQNIKNVIKKYFFVRG